MNENNANADNAAAQWAAFQKVWSETFTKMFQMGTTFSPEGPPPDFVRQMRASLLQAMAQSWDEFLRSPQFLDSMKQWMDNAIAFRKMSNDFLTRARHEGQGLAREDLDTVLLSVRHMETRVLDRLEAVGTRLKQVEERLNALAGKPSPPKKDSRKTTTTGGAP